MTVPQRLRPLVAAAAASLLVLSACAESTRGSTTPPTPDGTGGATSVSALADRYDARLPEPLVDPDEIRSGGPPPDGIPPIDSPTFEVARTVDWLEPDEPVLSLTIGGETRAYPVRVMTWHEIVNDTVGGVPVAVTYCPLCNSGVAFEREVDGRVLDFGTSGMLYVDNLVMYDRQTESLWPQLTGLASIGELTGTQLRSTAIGTVDWRAFLAAEPDATVLSQDTGFARPYGTNPYVGYDDPQGRLLFHDADATDARLPVKERVIGIGSGRDAVAVVRGSLAGAEPLVVEVGGRPVLVWHRPGQSSALDTERIGDGADIGTVGVLDPVLDGRNLTFARAGDGFRDEETGSRWDVTGRAVAGELAGERLAPVEHLDTFWFAWVTFHPGTTVSRAS